MAALPSTQPWRVVITTADGTLIETNHRTSQGAYNRVVAEREAIADGRSSSTAIRVERWNAEYDQWALYEQAYLRR
ncbi:hypothetical protein P3T36_007309 [Kitasatospora sp. MAP12-15]|uniref:hypothetical protein n=1 Tax=unclassified Kitasatospora TaxID=2633591 RepID=UPI0024751474|nr:hypothetical protein [Kitasatospora sp. MAP12-44]MDH6115020.1 hypothetical protein [Kitasatospora sp. MAP12-44]